VAHLGPVLGVLGPAVAHQRDHARVDLDRVDLGQFRSKGGRQTGPNQVDHLFYDQRFFMFTINQNLSTFEEFKSVSMQNFNKIS